MNEKTTLRSDEGRDVTTFLRKELSVSPSLTPFLSTSITQLYGTIEDSSAAEPEIVRGQSVFLLPRGGSAPGH